jgi:hypothetical protein
MRWLLVGILKMRRKSLLAHEQRILVLIEKYGGITQSDVVKTWHDELMWAQQRLADVTGRLRRAGVDVD